MTGQPTEKEKCPLRQSGTTIKNSVLFLPSGLEAMFTKHSPSEILSHNFEKKTAYLNCNFPF